MRIPSMRRLFSSAAAAQGARAAWHAGRAAILDGAGVSRAWQAELAGEAAAVRRALGRPPGLAVVIVGGRPDSQLYVQRKREACARVGITSSLQTLRADASQAELERVVRHLCTQDSIDGLIVQLPLPPHLNEEAVIDAFDPSKDVDGFHPFNVGRLIMKKRQRALVPCTALGCMELIRRSALDLQGKEAVLMGDSNVVGTPLAMLLRDSGVAALTLCSRPSMQALIDDRSGGSQRAAAQPCLPRLPGPSPDLTEQEDDLEASASGLELRQPSSGRGDSSGAGFFDLPAITRRADLLVVAVGTPGLVRRNWVKPGAVVLDVGINVVTDAAGGSHVTGDVAFDEVSEVAAAVTPVPGGIGPMTIAAVLHNTVQAAWAHAGCADRAVRSLAAGTA